MKLRKESLKNFQARWDLNLDLCDTGAALLKSGTIYVVKLCLQRMHGVFKRD